MIPIKTGLDALLTSLVDSIENVKAVAVVDRQGLIIHSILKSENIEFDDIIGSITAFFDNFVNRIKLDLGSAQDVINIMKVDDLKIVFVGAGPDAILTVFAGIDANDHKLRVFSSNIASKISQFLRGENFDPKIPSSLSILANIGLDTVPSGEYMPVIFILGSPMVGKSSLVNKFVKKTYSPNYVPTISFEITEKQILLAENCKVKFEIWDFGGHSNVLETPWTKRYQSATFALIMFDVTNRTSFTRISELKNDLERVKKPIPCLLIANKIDLATREISIEEIQEASDRLNCPFLELSTKEGTNVNELFQYIAYRSLLE